MRDSVSVIPAKHDDWVPACAGMTGIQWLRRWTPAFAGVTRFNLQIDRIRHENQLCNAAHISWSRWAVQMRGFLMPLASS